MLSLFVISRAAIIDATYKYDDKIASDVYMFVLHCSPDCEFCDENIKSLEDASDYFEDYDDKLIIGHANCRIRPDICKKYHITEHPTYLLWRNGQRVGEYKVPRVAAVIIEWLKVMTGINVDVESDIK